MKLQVKMGSKYKELRQELDSFGYIQKLAPECVPLVQKLLLDLKTTTENLEKYMKISQRALEEKDFLELGVEPYKCDNGKLIKECNDLHMAFINFKEQHEKMRRDFRYQISTLQAQLENCNVEKNKLVQQIQQLEKEKFRKGKTASKDPQINCKEGSSFRLSSDMAVADAKIVQLNKELKDLADKHLRLVEDNAVLKTQLKTRDEEICRLQSLVEGGRSYTSASKDCCFKNIDGQIVILQDEITQLKKERNNLHLEKKEALAKQHEAMRRALHLAERNRQLEKEMKDVDQIALAVEAECNSTVKGSTEKVARLQDRINESLILIQTLERDNTNLKQTKLELSAELESIKLEKNNLRKQLEMEVADKKKLTDKINSFTVIENDLNLEIDRLAKLNSEQKRMIVELESQVDSENVNIHDKRKNLKGVSFVPNANENMPNQMSPLNGQKSYQHKKTSKKPSKSPTKKNPMPTKLESGHQSDFTDVMQKCCCESGKCIKNLKELLDKEIEYRQDHTKQALDDVKQEKEYYMKEYHRVLEQMRNVPSYEISETGITQLKQQLRDKDSKIKQLEEEIVNLKIEQTRRTSESQGSVGYSPCNNPNCKNKDRELEIKSQELRHIELENDTLKAKLQSINESTIFNEDRLKSAFKEMEEHIRKLEDERRDLVKCELTQRSNISHLEDKYRSIQEQLKQTQAELSCQRANYDQLKLIHEQADRSLTDLQAQMIKAETELASYKNKCKDSNRDASTQDMEMAKLRSDIQIMKNQLTQMDRQKDDLAHDLDTNMDKISSLEDELDKKNKMVSKLESLIKDLNKKLSKYASESSRQDLTVRSQENELSNLESELEKERRLKDAALAENKRLQNDLCSVSYDSRDARNELEICKRQVEDLKRQLQHYVAEIKRTEDLITNKELERNELLDQFKSLSQEANVLESNNHTLETEANQCKVQLSVALDHSSELERQVEHRENMVRSYEKQIADLSAQVARLEVQLQQSTREQEQCNAEMKQIRDLCHKLDKDKDTLKNKLYNKEDCESQNQRVIEKLNSEMATLREALEEDKNRLVGVEKLLNEARRETTEQRLLNKDLQHEIERLQRKVIDLEEKLTHSETKHEDSKLKGIRTDNKHELSNRRCSDQSIQNDESKKSTSLLSTKTLTQQAKLGNVIDLTALDTSNEAQDAKFGKTKELYDAGSLKTLQTYKSGKSSSTTNAIPDITNLEKCDEYTHQKLLGNVGTGQSVICPLCHELIKLRKKVEIEESVQTSWENVAKRIDFAVKGKIKNSDCSKNQASFPSRSITSVKTLTWENSPSIRVKSKGTTDLTHSEQNDNAPTSNGKIDNRSNTDSKEAQLPSSPRLTEVKEILSDPSIWSEFNEQMINDYMRESDMSNPRINSLQTCCCPTCILGVSSSEPDFRCPKDTATCMKENLKQPDPNLVANDAASHSKRASGKKHQNDIKPCKGSTEPKKSQFLGSHKNTKVQTKFDQSSDSSAVFHKVFCVDGVGMECHCCISSFRKNDE